MILDSLTVGMLAAELAARHEGQYVRAARADAAGIDMLVAADGATEAACQLRLDYGPVGALGLGPGTAVHGSQGPERYLTGARIDNIAAVTGDRILSLRLARHDAASRLTFGLLHLILIPPRYRAVLVSEGHGRILGVWAGATDRHAPKHGALYLAPASATDRLVPGRDSRDALGDGLQQHGGSLADALRQTLSGADRHLVAHMCATVGLDPTAAAATVDADATAALWSVAERLWSVTGGPVNRWVHGPIRVSLAAPLYAEAEPVLFPTVSAALSADPDDGPPEPDKRAAEQHHRLARVLRVLARREQGLQADLDEADEALPLEHRGNSLMAVADTFTPGDSAHIPDAHDAHGEAAFEILLAPGETAAQHASQLLRRAAKLRRRAAALPPRLHRVRELIFETEELLDRLREGHGIPEETMARWERRVEVRQSPGQDADPAGKGEDDRSGARPRRYRTSTGWSVWAGRNNKENDVLSHRLAAQNDVWFHAHGYTGSHVILRREQHQEDPSRQTLEEAAAVAAYWSKGRTANKVPVVYTLAKYVSKPRGGAPGLAVLKREKSIMVRPALLAEEGSET